MSTVLLRPLNAVLCSMLVCSHIATPSLSAQDGEVAKGKDAVVLLDATEEGVHGRLKLLDSTHVVLLVAGEEQTFRINDVRSVKIRGDSKRNGALIGGVIGAVWCAVVCGQGLDSTSLLPLAVAANGAVGAVVGAGIDAAIPGYRTLYQRPPTRPLAPTQVTPALYRWRFW